MLHINKNRQNGVMIFELEGRLDTGSAPMLQDAVDEEIGNAEQFDDLTMMCLENYGNPDADDDHSAQINS